MASTEEENLILDADSRVDLNLFGSEGQGGSLYSYCNRCRTEGGQKALRRRMESPWSSARRIRATQESLSYIHAHREIFDELPSAYVALNVERYLSTAMPIVRQEKALGFSVAAFLFWVNDEQFYAKITKGVELTNRLLDSLRRFLARIERVTPHCELELLVNEMELLLSESRLAQALTTEGSLRFWKKLRWDQIFRMHEKSNIVRLLELTYELDALVSMADVTNDNGLVIPSIGSGEVSITAEDLVHPALLNAVPNKVILNQSNRVLFLTGPNMAGKTTYLRSIITAIYLAHLGMGVPATRFHFVPVQCLITSISLKDDLQDGISYFRAEALRVKAVAQSVAAGFRTIAILDEPFKGTNVKDAFDASLAILKRFAQVGDCLFIVSSHLIELSEHLNETQLIDYRYFAANERKDRLSFDYLLHQGISDQRLGMRILEEEGVFKLLDGDR